MENKIKVVWICSLRNELLREQLPTKVGIVERIVCKFLKRDPMVKFRDYAQWNTNAIAAIKNYNEVELHVVFPWRSFLPSTVYCFENEGVYYHAFYDEGMNYRSNIARLVKGVDAVLTYKNNNKIINQIVNEIKPDIVHLMGAENPNYSSSVLYLDYKCPLIVSLQTLMSEPSFFNNYKISKASYDYRSQMEMKVLRKADFIASGATTYIEEIRKNLLPGANILEDVVLCVGEDVRPFVVEKEYDFVYFANGIEKSFDLVVEALGYLIRFHPNVKVNASGSCTEAFKSQMLSRLEELGCKGAVDFTGPQQSHDDVLRQISKSRFAVLPLKVDLFSGTIREAMAMGLPVVTTITPDTPKINASVETILLSESGNHKALADNMARLLNDSDLAEKLRTNGLKYIHDVYPSNATRMEKWVAAYNNILKRE